MNINIYIWFKTTLLKTLVFFVGLYEMHKLEMRCLRKQTHLTSEHVHFAVHWWSPLKWIHITSEKTIKPKPKLKTL